MAGNVPRWLSAVVALSCALMLVGLPRTTHAQQVAPSRLAPSTVAPLRLPSRSIPSAASTQRRDSLSHSLASQIPDLPPSPRGPIAVRGLVVGAVVGAAAGFLVGRDQEYGGAVIGSLVGAVVGAPVGMLVLLLATPE